MPNPVHPDSGTLAEILSKRRLFIPRHQRPYDWKPEHVNALLDSVLFAINNNKPHRYLGVITLVSHPENKWEVSDGQQRITTFMLICAYLCKLFHERGDTGGVQSTIHILFDVDKFHGKTYEDVNKIRLPLRVQPLMDDDRANFRTLITGNTVKRNGKLVLAWRAINDFFLKPELQNADMQKKFLDFLLSKVYVGCMTVKDAEDSIDVFETENATGKPLEQIQLARSYLFSCLQGDEENSENLNKQLQKIRSKMVGNEERFFNYTRCFSLCRYGHLSSDRFYNDLKKAIRGKADEARDFAEELSEDYRIHTFQMLQRTTGYDEWFSELNKSTGRGKRRWTISDYVQDLRKHSAVSNAILFSLFCKYIEKSDTKQKKEAAKFVCISGKLLASFFQRASHSVSGSFNSSRYEAGTSELAMKITKGKCETSVDFLNLLKKIDNKEEIVSDAQYKQRMMHLSFSNTTTAKYLLSRINEYIDHDVNVSSITSTIEHILPKGKEYITNWDFTAEDLRPYVNRLGNLTLLSDTDNRSEKDINKSFEKKKTLYRRSSYKITQEVCDFKKWNKASVEKRQADLVEIAALVWNLDPNKF